MTDELEKAYQRKLDSLGKKYDALTAKLARYELGEDVPDAGAVSLLKKAVFHLGSAMCHYRERAKQLDNVSLIKSNTAQYAAARELREVYNFIIKMAEKKEVQT